MSRLPPPSQRVPTRRALKATTQSLLSTTPSTRTDGPGYGTASSTLSHVPDSHVSPAFSSSEYIKEPAAEFFGVMILIIFGNGVDCQTVLSKNTAVAASPMGVSVMLFAPGPPTAPALFIADARCIGHIGLLIPQFWMGSRNGPGRVGLFRHLWRPH